MEQVYHKRYVARRRARFKGCHDQQVNIPYGSILDAQDGFLLWKGEPLCVDTSQNAHEFFSQDDDGQGLERGRLVAAILARLETPPNAGEKCRAELQARWDKVWADSLCQKYKRLEHEDFWIWKPLSLWPEYSTGSLLILLKTGGLKCTHLCTPKLSFKANAPRMHPNYSCFSWLHFVRLCYMEKPRNRCGSGVLQENQRLEN